MRCPFCSQQLRDLFGLSLHIEDRHAELQGSVRVVVEAPSLPVVEVDIDAIHLKWPRQPAAYAVTEHEGADAD